MADTVHVVIIKETVKESILTDAITFMMVFSLVGIGIWLNSNSLQWIGGFFAIMAVSSRALGKWKRMTIAEARQFLETL